MATQTDVSQSDTLAQNLTAGYYAVNNIAGSPIGPCRVKEILVEISGFSDGFVYGGNLDLYDGNPASGGVLKLSLPFPGHKNTEYTTQSFLLPGQGLLFRKALWYYSDSTQSNIYRVVYG